MRFWYQKLWRLISHPYAFFEEAIQKGNPIPATLFFIGTWVVTYSGWWMVSDGRFRTSGDARWIGVLLPLVSYPAAVTVIFLLSRLLVHENQWRSFFAVWGYSYLPTFGFFLVNIGVHKLAQLAWLDFIFNQPIFLLVLWVVILLMLLWKLLFLAITLRLAGNLSLGRIALAIVLLSLVVAAYWWGMLSLGWLKIPFI